MLEKAKLSHVSAFSTGAAAGDLEAADWLSKPVEGSEVDSPATSSIKVIILSCPCHRSLAVLQHLLDLGGMNGCVWNDLVSDHKKASS